MAHLDEYKLLSDRQHAFRKGHSCETQLTTVINDWAKILDNRGQVDIFILDLEKAFDTPPHELLKSKLFSYGIGSKTLKWLDYFLGFRQRVVVNLCSKIWLCSGFVECPPGTVLGPLLFSLYINDISSDIESEKRLFADDCVCYHEIKDEDWLCWGLTSQSTIFQSCRDGAIASWVINQYFRGVKCLAQGHNTAAVGFEPRTSRSGVRHSTTEPPRSPKDEEDTMKLQRDIDQLGSWARKWDTRFQPVKCNMMQLTRKRIKKIHASYILEGTDLENV